ncbi:MAG: UDP-N-acetylmuramate--L-alanine ligase [Candidatus Borkfalkiaceae bacterium]|nr:UDP-N-acetylmuramate--L-alanine ligase [Christensenellaceae bacterium]
MEKTFSYKKIHLTGVGGVSMSSIAKYLLECGCEVSGSDINENDFTRELISKGLAFYKGHGEDNVGNAEVLVYNSAIKPDNEEIVFAESKGIPVLGRMEFLSLLSDEFRVKAGIAGCHGKTTCTGMVANVLKNAGKKIFAHIGGNVIPFGNCLYTGKDIFVSEICEYKKNVDLFTADIAAVTNVGFDHPDCYRNENDIAKAYHSFLKRAKISIINADDEILCKFKERTLSFGVKNGDVRAENIKEVKNGVSFQLIFNGLRHEVKLNVHGKYNVYNALCAFCVCYALEIDEEQIVKGLNDFSGVKRRFEKIGAFSGVPVICDYAHHPKEIENSLKTAKEIFGENIAVIFQSHTYSRTKALLTDFVSVLNECKSLCIYKTFPAREKFDKEGDGKRIFEKIDGSVYADTPEILKKYLRETTEKGVNLILALGAGDIYDIMVKTTDNN